MGGSDQRDSTSGIGQNKGPWSPGRAVNAKNRLKLRTAVNAVNAVNACKNCNFQR